jgi:hypothetical protein
MGQNKLLREVLRGKIWQGMIFKILYELLSGALYSGGRNSHLFDEAPVLCLISDQFSRLCEIILACKEIFTQGHLAKYLNLYYIKITIISASVIQNENCQAVCQGDFLDQCVHLTSCPKFCQGQKEESKNNTLALSCKAILFRLGRTTTPGNEPVDNIFQWLAFHFPDLV